MCACADFVCHWKARRKMTIPELEMACKTMTACQTEAGKICEAMKSAGVPSILCGKCLQATLSYLIHTVSRPVQQDSCHDMNTSIGSLLGVHMCPCFCANGYPDYQQSGWLTAEHRVSHMSSTPPIPFISTSSCLIMLVYLTLFISTKLAWLALYWNTVWCQSQ